MPTFDLGNDLNVTQQVASPFEHSYELTRQIVDGYKKLGYQVRFDGPPQQQQQQTSSANRTTKVGAQITKSDGTRIRVDVDLRSTSPTRTTLKIKLTGKVFVGGFKGAFADDAAVQKKAREMLLKEIKKALKANGLLAGLEALARREQLYAAYQQQEAARTNRYA